MFKSPLSGESIPLIIERRVDLPHIFKIQLLKNYFLTNIGIMWYT